MAQESRPVTGTPKASVIVLAWNGIEYLEGCLDAVLAQRGQSVAEVPDFEVIVVDNGSTDSSPDLVARRFPQVRLICNERNLGFAAGNNVGLRAARGDLLVLLNQDTRVHLGWLAALTAALDNPAVAMVGCKLLYPDGTIQHAGAYLCGPRGEAAHIGHHVPDAGPQSEPGAGQFDHAADVEFVTAAAIAISRAAWQKIGDLDEGFAPAYYEDVDWCYRARAAGYRVVYHPEAVATHYESTSTHPDSYERKLGHHQGRLRLLFKHRPVDALLKEFRSAEMAWLQTLDRNVDLMAARRAYLNTMLALPDIVAFRAGSPAEARALLALLSELREAAAAGLAEDRGDGLRVISGAGSAGGLVAAAEFERARLLVALRDDQALREHIFASDMPVLGWLVAAIRGLWNSISTKWYVRPVLHQQSLFNTQLVSYLYHLEQHLQGQSRDMAENIREVTVLSERLVELGTQPSDPPQAGTLRD